MKGYINYYEVLGISRNATSEEIKKAYRNLAKENHPDLLQNVSEEEIAKRTNKFQEIVNAYEILGNEVKRQKYDKKLANYEEIQEAARRDREERKQKEAARSQNAEKSQTEERTQNKQYNYSTNRTQYKHEARKGRHTKESKPIFGKFTKDIKQSWNEVRKEEMKAPFFKRHKSLNGRIHRILYKEDGTTTDKVIYGLTNGTLHIFVETLFQLEKLTHITEDTIPKYIIRNRSTIAAILLIATLISVASKDKVDKFILPTDKTPIYSQQITETENSLELDDLYYQDEQQKQEETNNQDYKVYRTYKVQSDDTLTDLAIAANTSVAEIKDINKMNSDDIKLGETLYIPYNIKQEDLGYATTAVEFPVGTDIFAFAESYSTNALSLYNLNKEAFDNDQVISDTLLVPTFASKNDIRKQKTNDLHLHIKK